MDEHVQHDEQAEDARNQPEQRLLAGVRRRKRRAAHQEQGGVAAGSQQRIEQAGQPLVPEQGGGRAVEAAMVAAHQAEHMHGIGAMVEPAL